MSIDRAPTVCQIPGPVGPLEALLTEPVVGPDGHAPNPRGAVVFGHPHPKFGGTMHTKVVYQAAKAFARIGCATLRFNFRGVGLSAGVWDDGRGEQDDYRAALDFAAVRYPHVELWTAGFSFGAWIALSVGAADPRVCALIGIASPVDTKPEYDLSAVVASTKPKFLIHGERDELIPLTRMWTVLRPDGGAEGARRHRCRQSSFRWARQRGRRRHRGPVGRFPCRRSTGIVTLHGRGDLGILEREP